MTVGSLFAGIGGFDLGFTRAGFTVSWQVEIDEWCRGILSRHFPNAERYADIRDTGAHNLAPVDVICGGFPCQPFSSAGKRGGAEDDRYLWPEMCRVIRELQPAWVVAENVNGLVVGEMAPVFEQVLSDLEDAGYDVQSFVIPACAVDAPHRRDRVWIVAHARRARIYERRVITDAKGKRARPGGVEPNGIQKIKENKGAAVAHATGERPGEAWKHCAGSEERTARNRWTKQRGWEPEPGVRRVANGIPDRVDRLKSLGNAVVPQIPELIARMILQTERIEALRRLAA